MASLLDIAPARETIDIRGVSVEVKGVSADVIVALMQRFGNVFEVFQGGDFAKVAAGLKPAIAAVIAAATGDPGDEKAELMAADLSVGEQASLLAAIRRLTMPKGVRPFLDDLADLGLPLDLPPPTLVNGHAVASESPATKSRRPSSN